MNQMAHTVECPSDPAPSVPVVLSPRVLRAWPLPAPRREGDKEERGRVMVVGGSRQMPGAVILAATAALRAGAGKLRIAAPRGIALAVGAAIPEGRIYALGETRDGGIDPTDAAALLSLAETAQAVLIGPGMLDEAAIESLLCEMVPRLSLPVILDAGALAPLFGQRELLRRCPGAVILTPHEGEMAHLCGLSKDAVTADRLGCAFGIAKDLRSIIALKGRETLIVGPQGEAFLNLAGNNGLATSGSGDTLAGVIAGLLARGAEPVQAAVWGVYLHASAGDRLAARVGPLGFLARELLAEIPPLMAGLSMPEAAARRGPRRRRTRGGRVNGHARPHGF